MKQMITLVKAVRFIVWTVVLTLTTTIAGICLFGTYKLVMRINWDDLTSIFTSIGIIMLLIVGTFIAGGFVLWAIREHVLPLGPEEEKEKSKNNK